ncbi:MAG: hypothetical protein ACFE9S_13180 [Candidatus Hermodarchaeota archaeon]
MKFKETIRKYERYLTIFIGFILSLALFVAIFILGWIQMSLGTISLIPPEYLEFFIKFLPGKLLTDAILLYLFPLISFGIFYLIAPYTTMILIKLHKLIYLSRKRFQYGIIDLGPRRKPLFLFRRALIVTLFSLSAAGIIIQAGLGYLFRENLVVGSALNEAEALFLATFFIIPFVLLIFLPIWFLEDAGIVIYRNYTGQQRTPVLEGVHAPFLNVLQGYAGISTIIVLIIYIGRSFGELGVLDPALLTPIILIILPFLTTGIMSLALFLYEKYNFNLLNRIQPTIKKLNLSPISVPTFDEMKIA